MTQFSPSPANPYVPNPTRTRLRWDNLAVLCAALAVVGGVTTTIMSQGAEKPKPTQAVPAGTAPTALPTVDGAGTDATTITDATLEDALALVSEAREFTSQGRWEEAADRLASIDAGMRPATEADLAQRELEAAQASWTRLDTQLRTQVDAKDWTAAGATLDQLAELAPLGEDQLLLQDRVDAALAPAAAATAVKPAATVAKPAATTTTAATTATPAAATGGGAATAAKPVAAAAKPAATATKPATSAARPAAATAKPAANGTTSTSVGGITITMPSGTGTGGQDVDAAQLEQLLGAVTTG